MTEQQSRQSISVLRPTKVIHKMVPRKILDADWLIRYCIHARNLLFEHQSLMSAVDIAEKDK